MRHPWLLCILAAATTLATGCKTDQAAQHAEQIDSHTSDTAPAPAPLPDIPQDSRPILACFGDSLTAGYGADPGQSYPDFLQADLDTRGYAYHVVNEGISGNTTKDGVDRLDRILRLKPAVVVVEFGGNDGLRGLPIEQSRANLDTILKTLTASGAKVVLAGITLPPDYGPDYIRQFNQTYALLANKYHVPMIPFLLQGVFGVPGMMQADRTHATDAGNQVVAKTVLTLVTPLLKH
jgi:acyl-CoA thioesterase-1